MRVRDIAGLMVKDGWSRTACGPDLAPDRALTLAGAPRPVHHAFVIALATIMLAHRRAVCDNTVTPMTARRGKGRDKKEPSRC